MAKIKIIEKETELEGSIEKGNVKPFGTSAHIPFTKKHMGKKVNIIIPENPELVWVLSQKDKVKMIQTVKKHIFEENGKLQPYRLKVLENIEEDDFNEDDLIKFAELLKSAGNHGCAFKIKKTYNL